MKKKTKRKVRPMIAPIDEARILQLSNDMSENIASGTVREWRAVAYYFRHCFDDCSERLGSIRTSLAALDISVDMRAAALGEIKAWLKRNGA